MSDLNLAGLIPATVLPMQHDGSPDEQSLRGYIRWIAAQGAVALAVNVDTGEGPHLTHGEHLRILEVVGEETSLPLVAGLRGPFTSQAVAQARDLKSAGASALLVFPISAYLSDPLDPEIPLAYHRAIAEVGLPMILFQLQPALGGLNFELETLRELINIDMVVALKEASFDARRYLATLRMVEDHKKYQDGDFTLLTGNDNFILESFILGCGGALIGFGAVMTREQVEMIEAWKAGRHEEAMALGRRIQHLADVVFARPVGNYRARLKEALVMLRIIPEAFVRAPLLPASTREREMLRAALVEVGLLKAQEA